MQTILAKFGLVPRAELERALAKKEVWHSLVRDVFARYYLKLREPFPDLLPDLPRRYARGWEQQMKKEVDIFLEVDLKPVGQLLDTCGFGTPRWPHFMSEILPRLEQIIAEEAPATDSYLPTAQEMLRQELEDAQEEIHRLRLGGRHILEQLRAHERQTKETDDDPENTDDTAGTFAQSNFPTATNDGDQRAELERENRELRGQLVTREQTISSLNNQLEDLEGEMDLHPSVDPETDDDLRTDVGDNAEDALRYSQELQRNLHAKEHTISALRGRVEEMEDEMGSARDQLLDEVKKLGDLAAGQIEIKASEELEQMEADDLLDYAREVATDLDVRRQTLDEGLSGIDTLKDNYQEGRERYEQQQHSLEQQLEQVMTDLQEYEEKAQQEEEKAKERDQPGESEEHDAILTTQREQLRLLGGRIKELQDTNHGLSESNQKMYRDLDTAVKRIIPLRNQIEELESLRDALSNFVRQKYDRTFTINKLG